jgi:hypothetical protein
MSAAPDDRKPSAGDHTIALETARAKRRFSNLARCYLDQAAELQRLRAQVGLERLKAGRLARGLEP